MGTTRTKTAIIRELQNISEICEGIQTRLIKLTNKLTDLHDSVDKLALELSTGN